MAQVRATLSLTAFCTMRRCFYCFMMCPFFFFLANRRVFSFTVPSVRRKGKKKYEQVKQNPTYAVSEITARHC